MKKDQVYVNLNGVAIALCVACVLGGAALTAALDQRAPLFLGAMAGLYLLLAVKVARPWEKVAVLRLGRIPVCAALESFTSFRLSRR